MTANRPGSPAISLRVNFQIFTVQAAAGFRIDKTWTF
jgi:hypothetical protein